MTTSSNVHNDPDEINWLDLLQVFAENIRLLLIGPIAAGLVALGVTFFVRPTFTATTVFLPPQQQQSSAALLLQSLGALGGITSAATGLKNPNDQFVAFLRSRYIEDNLIEQFHLKDRFDVKMSTEARKALEQTVDIRSSKDGLIIVDVDDHDPIFAAKLANAHVEELDKLMQRMAVTEAQQRRAFFEIQLVSTKDKLTKAEIALRSSGVNSSALKNDPKIAVEVVAKVQAEVAAQEVKIASMRSYLSESAPVFKLAVSELAALRAQMGKLEKTTDTSNTSDSDYVARFRDFKYYETLFELFAKQFELAKVDESRESGVVQVLDRALPPEIKSKPKRGLIAIVTTLATGVLLLVFVFVRNSYRKLVASQDGAKRIAAIGTAIRKRKNG